MLCNPFSVSYLTADTVAYFNDPKHVSNVLIMAGVWEDEDDEVSTEDAKNSSLAFIEHDDLIFTTCLATIEVDIENNGDGSMQSEGTHDVYFSESGNPKEDGEAIELEEGVEGERDTALLDSKIGTDGEGQEDGSLLPKTATNVFTWIMFGVILMINGSMVAVYLRRGVGYT